MRVELGTATEEDLYRIEEHRLAKRNEMSNYRRNKNVKKENV
jgi:hypothetical protein